MKRRIFSIVLVIGLVAITLAGCGDDEKKTTTTDNNVIDITDTADTTNTGDTTDTGDATNTGDATEAVKVSGVGTIDVSKTAPSPTAAPTEEAKAESAEDSDEIVDEPKTKENQQVVEPKPAKPTEAPKTENPTTAEPDIAMDEPSSSDGDILADNGSSGSSSSGTWDYNGFASSVGARARFADDMQAIFFVFNGGDFIVGVSTSLAGTSDSLIVIGYESNGGSVCTYDANYITPYGESLQVTDGIYVSSYAVSLLPAVISYTRSNGVDTMPPSSLIGFSWENW